MTQRTERIDELLRQEITSLLTKEIADPDIGFATVTEVETSPDLRHARVWVSVIGQPKDRATTLRGLERAMPFVRRELGRRLRLRRIPEFSVKLDDSIERGSRVMHLISELEAGATPDELPAGESLPTPAVRLHHDGDAAADADDPTTTDATAAAAADRKVSGSARAGGRRSGDGARANGGSSGGRAGGTRTTNAERGSASASRSSAGRLRPTGGKPSGGRPSGGKASGGRAGGSPKDPGRGSRPERDGPGR